MKLRLVCVLATNGRVLSYDYGTAADINDVTSRVQSIKFAAEAFNLVDYQYLGASGFVNAASSQPGTNWTLYGSSNDPNTGDIYSGLDRFGRVDNCLWQKGSTTLAQIQYGYDRASNRTWRKDGVLTGYDELYLYDGLNRLKDQIRGTLNGTQTAITTRTFQQQWGLDATGNWQAFKQDTDGNGTWDLVQSRTANKANEITAINNTTGTAWVTPGYDRAGNMIGIPNPTISSTATYDAWNRLISVTDASTSITNDYDARGFRITETTGGVVRRYHYTPGWQCVEERTGSLTTPERQFVWERLRPPTDEGGRRPKAVAGNVDSDLVIRDRSTANNGSINERRYAMQDGNWNTVAICDITGTVGERYAYSAYGTPVFMTGAGTVQTSSPVGFETLYAGYRWDNPTPQMYYVRNRYLLPQVGTWNKRDPLGYVDGMNLYVPQSTVSTVDPYGEQDWQLGFTEEEITAKTLAKIPRRRCIFYMKSNAADEATWLSEAERLKTSGESGSIIVGPVTDSLIIPQAIRANHCCEIVLLGHRGGLYNPGISVGGVPVLPDDNLAREIGAAVKENTNSGHCPACLIRVGACGIRNATHSDLRQICNIYSFSESEAQRIIKEFAPYEQYVWQRLARDTGRYIESANQICQFGFQHTLVPGGVNTTPGDPTNTHGQRTLSPFHTKDL